MGQLLPRFASYYVYLTGSSPIQNHSTYKKKGAEGGTNLTKYTLHCGDRIIKQNWRSVSTITHAISPVLDTSMQCAYTINIHGVLSTNADTVYCKVHYQRDPCRRLRRKAEFNYSITLQIRLMVTFRPNEKWYLAWGKVMTSALIVTLLDLSSTRVSAL